jgi:putative transposase
VELSKTIKSIHESSRGTYGAPRIHAELKDDHHIHCSCKRVARLMRQAGLEGVHRRKYKGTTKRDPKRDPYPDLVERQFDVDAANKLWVADATQHETDEGWLYLAVVIDAYSRLVVGWATTEGSPCGMDEHFTAELVLGALEMALWNRKPEEGLIHHSDHGSQYTSLAFGERLEQSGVLGSMGTVGDALDNALAESFFATLQTELLLDFCSESCLGRVANRRIRA